MSKRESAFQSDLFTAIQKAWGAGAYVQNNHGSSYSAGLPDVEAVIQGASVYAELKVANHAGFDWNKQPTPLQLDTLMNISRAGGNARVLALVAPLGLVFVRSPEWILKARGGQLFGRKEGAAWSRSDLDLAPWCLPWHGKATDRVTLAKMLLEWVI